jgi:hypothetical protein
MLSYGVQDSERFQWRNTKSKLRMLRCAWRVGLTGIREIKGEYL